jgi:hypothetical protein
LRFREVLGESHWAFIYDRILTEGRLHRETHDSLARTAATSSVSIKIDAQTLGATTSHEAYQIIESSGFGIVSAGYAAFIRDNAKLLSPAEHDRPRIRLVCGYASMSLGDYFGGRADLGRALAGRMELSEIDRYFLDAILLECDQRLVRIDDSQYRRRRRELEANAPRMIALQLRLHRLRFEHLYAGPDRDERLPWSQQLASVVGEIESDTDASDSLKLEARLCRLFARAIDENSELIRTLTLLRMRREMGQPTNTESTIQKMCRQQQAQGLLDQEADGCVQEAVRLQHPLIIAESIVARAVILIVRATTARMIVAEHGKPLRPIPDTVVNGLLGQLRSAEAHFRQAQNAEGTVRAVLLQADWLEAAGNFDEARQRAFSVEGLAIGMGYEQDIERIAAFRSERTKQGQQLESISASEFDDTKIALATDDELQRCAKDCLESLDLPQERLPILEREWQSIRGIAIEKRNWCRHLELQQNLLHTGSRLMHYRRDPDRSCLCTLHMYRSKVESPDWVVLIAEFKRRFCNRCRDRSPAHPPP